MPHPKVPKHLRKQSFKRTGYGYVSMDYMYRIFRYKWTHSYHVKELQRWRLMKPDGKTEDFETMLQAKQRAYDLMETSAVRKEEKKLETKTKKRNNR